MGRPEETQRLQNGLAALRETRAGHSIAAAIRGRGTTVRFGQTDEDAIEANRVSSLPADGNGCSRTHAGGPPEYEAKEGQSGGEAKHHQS